jgi:hypothetical protein
MSQDLGLEDSHQTGDAEKQQGVLPGTDIPITDIKNDKVPASQILKHTIDADVALEAFASYRDGAIIEIDEETNRRLLRKIDWNLMPVMIYLHRCLPKLT